MERKQRITEFDIEEYKEFFSWLLDKNDIKIEKEYDISRCLEMENSYIYYTPDIKDFFETKAMKRLEKIGQDSNVKLLNANAFQNRLEHCKGAYQKILDFYMIQFQKANWKSKNSNEDSKLKILADIMDMASHDIGHNICSHALEILIGKQKGAHEIIGDRILHENSEIVNAFYNIHPQLLHYMDIVKSQEYDLHTLKEGNIDFDRCDFLTRDSLYIGVENGFEAKEDSDTIPVLMDDIMNGCEIYPVRNKGKTFQYPVYSYKVEPKIEEFLQRRVQNYSNIYISKDTMPNDIILQEFCKTFIDSKEKSGKSLRFFLEHIANNSIDNINLDLYLEWNDIKFFNSLFEIVENSNDENVRRFALLCLPSVDAMISIVQNDIFSNITPPLDENGNELGIENSIESEDDKKFYLKVRDIVFKRDKKYYNRQKEDACLGVFFTTSYDKDKFLKKLKDKAGISDKDFDKIDSWHYKINPYNKKEPIFIIGKDKKVYTIDEFPDRRMDFTPQENFGVMIIEPKLAMQGMDTSEISLLVNAFSSFHSQNKINFGLNINDTRLTSELIDMKYKKQEADSR